MSKLFIRIAVWWSDSFYLTPKSGPKMRERLEDWRDNVFAVVEEYQDGRATWKTLDKEGEPIESGVEINRDAAKRAAEKALKLEGIE